MLSSHRHNPGGNQIFRPGRVQMLRFRAATANAFTTVFAGFAFTMTVLPNISRVPALVAGFTRVLILQRPGMVNTPLLFTSLAAISARLLIVFVLCARLSSHLSANATARAPFVITALFAFVAFIAFMAFVGSMFERVGEEGKDTTLG